MLLFPILSIIVFVIMIITAEWNIQIIITFILADTLSILFFALFILIKIKNNKLKEKIIIWLEDAIEVKAYSKKIGENRLGFQPKATKIQVKFKINGKSYIKDSTAKVLGSWAGYLGTFNKYADREINVLYSLKYDEVLIMKDK